MTITSLIFQKIIQQSCRILTEKGSLFVHMTTTSVYDSHFYMRLVMNQAFGDKPIYKITWQKKRLRFIFRVGLK